MKRPFRRLSALIATLIFTAASAEAAEIIYEPFDYATGTLDGSQTNGMGFATNGWTTTDTGSNPYEVQSGGLSFANLPVAGNKCARGSHRASAEMNRPISAASQSALLANGQTIWFSVLFRNFPYSTGNEHQSIVLGTDAFTDFSSAPPGMAGGEGFGVGYNTQYALKAVKIDEGTSSYSSGSMTTVDDTTYLIAGKITWAANGSSDTLLLFNIADPDDPKPADGDAFASTDADLDQSLFDTIAVASKQKSKLDEIRFATTFAEAMGREPDTTAPTYTTLSPTNNAVDILTASDLVITFDEDIKKGTGNIEIRETDGDALHEAIDVTTAAVTVGGAQVTIDPSGLFDLSSEYYVLIPAGALEDLSDNPFAGISSTTEWSFTTEATSDTTPPTRVALSPADDTTGVAYQTDLQISFDEDVQKGAGDIVIRESVGDALFESIDVTGAHVTITDSNVVINPAGSLAFDTGYYVTIANGVIEDLVGNPFAGITTSTEWNFTTEVDYLPPTPSPMTFAVAPASVDSSTIAMTATTATDVDSPPVTYLFTNTVNGDVSGWVADTVWTNNSLDASTTYGYQVKARDALLNETGWSDEASASTLFEAFTPDSSLIVYEGFQYNAVGDSLLGQPDDAPATDVDATGLAGTWTDDLLNGEMFMKVGSLAFGDLTVSGSHVGFDSNANNDLFHRTLTSDAQSQVAGLAELAELWFSFLAEKPQNNYGAAEGGFALGNQPLANNRIYLNDATDGLAGFGVGPTTAGDNWTAFAWDGTSQTVGDANLDVGIGTDDVRLLVGKVSLDTGAGGADQYTLYEYQLNDGAMEGGTLSPICSTIEIDVDQSTLDVLNLTRQVNVNYDEVRIGPNLDAVLGLEVPPTGTLILLK